MEHEDLFSSLFEIMAIFGSTKNLNPEDMNGFKKLTQSLNTAIIAKSGDTKNIDMKILSADDLKPFDEINRNVGKIYKKSKATELAIEHGKNAVEISNNLNLKMKQGDPVLTSTNAKNFGDDTIRKGMVLIANMHKYETVLNTLPWTNTGKKTMEGLFNRARNAYEMRFSLVYSKEPMKSWEECCLTHQIPHQTFTMMTTKTIMFNQISFNAQMFMTPVELTLEEVKNGSHNAFGIYCNASMPVIALTNYLETRLLDDTLTDKEKEKIMGLFCIPKATLMDKINP